MEMAGRILTVMLLSGNDRKTVYQDFQKEGQSCHLQAAGYRIDIRDRAEVKNGVMRFCTAVSGKRMEPAAETEKNRQNTGFAVSMRFAVKGAEGSLRPGVPSAVYSGNVDREHGEYRSFMEDRLTGPMITLFDEYEREAVTLRRLNSPRLSDAECREKGDSRFLHRTDVASLGYGYDQEPYFILRFPYEEREKSPALDAEQTPAEAFYPLEEEKFFYTFEYEISIGRYRTFSDAVYEEFRSLAGEKKRRGENVVSLTFGRKEEMEFRKDSVLRTYREFGENGAGYFFHFDPKKGYGSASTGFGSSFNTIPHDTYTHILEYGFTGRQIDIALTLAKKGEAYERQGEKVIDFFVNNCVYKNGWVYTLYDLEQRRPFASFGDNTAPKLHYMTYGNEEGNYLRTMTEAVYDLLKAYQWYKARGKDRPEWAAVVNKYAEFLLDRQNEDGSWYRTYTKEGSPVFMNEDRDSTEEEKNRGRKASSAIPVPFLCALAEEYPEDRRYEKAAVRAAEYTLSHECRKELYQGGTMDNPNIVDKEAAQYVMAGLYSLYSLTGKKKYLEGAGTAAKQFVTWNYIWNAPMRAGTILSEKGFCTKGMGAINSVWCGGVVDIYSLFHIRELYLTGQETGEEFMKEMADWISIAAHQILSRPGDSMGFADSGMQPEGFGICPQGLDEGMIRKGDIWGTLGWIYSAGIGGVERYLECRQKDSGS